MESNLGGRVLLMIVLVIVNTPFVIWLVWKMFGTPDDVEHAGSHAFWEFDWELILSVFASVIEGDSIERVQNTIKVVIFLVLTVGLVMGEYFLIVHLLRW